MKKLYRKLTKDQKARGIIFSSCLQVYKFETDKDGSIHELDLKLYQDDYKEYLTVKKRLLDDSFFNGSHWNYNIIRD
jgi:hypothetical protein